MSNKFAKLGTAGRTESGSANSPIKDQQLPHVYEIDEYTRLPQWINANREALRRQLHKSGALLFRGQRNADLDLVFSAFTDDSVDFRGGTAIRSRVNDGTYTASEYPNELEIRQHSEFCYSNNWPMLLFFQCDIDEFSGGQTPLVDNRALLRQIDSAVVAEFRERGLRYTRGYGYNRTWQRSYETEDRTEVERICVAEGRTVEWLADDQLRTTENREAIVRHPVTGEEVWFNYAIGFHISRMDDEIRDSLSTSPRDDDEQLWPNNVTWGDGSPIPAKVIEHIQGVVAQNTVQFDWAKGDILVVDNMLSGHGRRPFYGRRRILLKMAEAYSDQITAESAS